MIPILAAFYFEPFLLFLVWGIMLVFNLWMWQKSKAKGNLLMLVGAGCLALSALLWAFGTVDSKFILFWLPLIGAALLVVGFYFTVKPMVDENIAALREKLKEATKEKEEGGEEKAEEKAEE
jgi:hypothetical protein